MADEILPPGANISMENCDIKYVIYKYWKVVSGSLKNWIFAI